MTQTLTPVPTRLSDEELTVGTTVTIDGDPAVILGRTADGLIEAYQGDAIINYGTWVTAYRLTEPEAQAALLLRALRVIDGWRRQALELEERVRLNHDDELRRIRSYAIERHQAGDICESGLNDFLSAFDLGEYEPRLRVSYVIRGSYLVSGSDDYSARLNAESFIGTDLSNVDYVVDDTAEHKVEIEELESVDG